MHGGGSKVAVQMGQVLGRRHHLSLMKVKSKDELKEEFGERVGGMQIWQNLLF